MQKEIENQTTGQENCPAEEKTKKQIPAAFRVILFLVLLCLTGVYLLNVFDMKDDKGAERVFNSFYSARDDSLDGIYIGSSSAYRFWIPTFAYENTGMTISNLGTGSQPVVLQKYIIKEALKSQKNMKVIVIDIRSLLNNDKRLKEADIRRVTDAFHVMDSPLKINQNRIDAIDAALDYFRSQNAEIEYTKAYYYFPFLKYHNRWQSDLTLKDLTALHFRNRYKGFVFTASGSLSVKKVTPPEFTDEAAELEDSSKTEVLQDLLKYCSGLDQEVVFVLSPYMISQQEQKQMNAYTAMIEEAGFSVLNFNKASKIRQLGIHWNSDFMDTKHVNVYGAMKYTEYLMQYLKKHVELPDHRGDENYESWNKAVERFYTKLELLEQMKEEGTLELNFNET